MAATRQYTLRRGVFQLPTAPGQDKLQAFAGRDTIESVCLARDDQLLFVCTKGGRLRVNNGMDSIAAMFGVPAGGIEILPMRRLDVWLKERWDLDDPANCSVFPFHYGPLMDPDSLRSIQMATKGKENVALRNRYIAQHSLQDCLDSGVISHDQASRVKDGLDILNTQEEDRNPDLCDHLLWLFQHMREDPDTFEVAPTGTFPDREVTIRAFPDNTTVRRKHYWIYSNASGFGKTYFLKAMEQRYNASIVGDKNNMTGLSERSQFLLFDEGSSLPEVEMLKALTSGCGTVFMNKKTYGRSFKPREDVQIVVCCNKSPYEVYGTYCSKMRLRYMDINLRDQLESRFHVIKLDGDMQPDRMKFSDPVSWSPEEYRQNAQSRFYSACAQLDLSRQLRLRDVKRALFHGLKVHERRAGEALTNLLHFESSITDGMPQCDADLVKYALGYKDDADDIMRYSSGDRRLVRLGSDNAQLHAPLPGAAHAPNYVVADNHHIFYPNAIGP